MKKIVRQMRNQQWYRCHETKADPSQIISSSIHAMRTQQEQLVERCRRIARAYGCEAQLFGVGAPMTDVQGWRAPTNILANIIDSLQADIYKSFPAAMPVTDKGEWRQQRRASELGDFFEGVFQESKGRQLALLAGMHALLFGAGVWKCVEDAWGRIRYEVVPRWELYVDELDARHGDPMEVHHRTLIDRGVLFERYVQPEDHEGLFGTPEERADIIEGASLQRESWYDDDVWQRSDMVTVTQSFRRPTGPDTEDGRYCVTVLGGNAGGTLVDMAYEPKRLPFWFMTTSPPIAGVDGDSVANRMLHKHDELAFVDARFQDAIAQIAVPRVYIQKGSGLTKEHITDEISVLAGTSPNGPTVLNWTAITQDAFTYREMVKREHYEISGTSSMQTSSELPAGLRQASGVALQAFEDQHSARHAVKYSMAEGAAVGLAWLAFDKAEAIAEREGGYQARIEGKGSMRRIDWEAVRMDSDDFVLTVLPTSHLSKLPSARFEQLLKMLELGAIDMNGFRKAWRMGADVEGELGMASALYDVILDRLDIIAHEGRYMGPEPIHDLPLAIRTARLFYAKCEQANDFPEEHLLSLRQFLQEAEKLDSAAKAKAAALAAPPMPLPLPGGPMPPPMPPGGPMPPPGAPPAPLPNIAAPVAA